MTRWVEWIVAVIAVIACPALAWASEPSEHPVAEVVAFTGNPTVMRGGAGAAASLAVHDVLYERDRITTPAASKVKIRFADDSTVTAGELTVLDLTTAKVKLGKDGRRIVLTMASGWFRSTVQRLTEQESFVLRTPTAVGAVRGTEFGAVLKAGSTGMFVKQGKVEVANVDEAIRGAVTLTDGEGTDIAAGQPPAVPKRWGPARVTELMNATTLP